MYLTLHGLADQRTAVPSARHPVGGKEGGGLESGVSTCTNDGGSRTNDGGLTHKYAPPVLHKVSVLQKPANASPGQRGI